MCEVLKTPTLPTKPKRVSPRKGRWSTEQKLKFKEGLGLYGKNWKKIQSYIRSRSLLQIRSHAQKYFLMSQKLEQRSNLLRKNFNDFDFVHKNNQKVHFQSTGSLSDNTVLQAQTQLDSLSLTPILGQYPINNNNIFYVPSYGPESFGHFNIQSYPVVGGLSNNIYPMVSPYSPYGYPSMMATNNGIMRFSPFA